MVSQTSHRSFPRGAILPLSVIFVLFVSLLSTTQARGASPNLVAAYSFDEGAGTTVADASGSGNTGTLAGATWTGSGKINGALSFNGTSSRVDVPTQRPCSCPRR